MARHDDQVGDAGPRLVIAHDHQVGIVRRRQPGRHRPIGAVDQLAVNPALGGLEFIFLGADAAMEVRHGKIGREGSQGFGAAVGTEGIGALDDGRLFGEAEVAPRGLVFVHGSER